MKRSLQLTRALHFDSSQQTNQSTVFIFPCCSRIGSYTTEWHDCRLWRRTPFSGEWQGYAITHWFKICQICNALPALKWRPVEFNVPHVSHAKELSLSLCTCHFMSTCFSPKWNVDGVLQSKIPIGCLGVQFWAFSAPREHRLSICDSAQTVTM